MAQGDHILLCLDLGTETGWALVKNGRYINSGEVALRKGLVEGTRFLEFRNWLMKWRGVHEIVYEQIVFFSTAAVARVYCGLLAELQVFCILNNINCRPASVKQLKKEFTGNGNADKLKMCEVAHKLGWKRGQPGTDWNHNECDAIAMAWVEMNKRGIQLKLSK